MTKVGTVVRTEDGQQADKEEKQSTSLKVRPSVWKAFKIAAINRDEEVGETLEYVIREFLKTPAAQGKVEEKDKEREKEKVKEVKGKA